MQALDRLRAHSDWQSQAIHIIKVCVYLSVISFGASARTTQRLNYWQTGLYTNWRKKCEGHSQMRKCRNTIVAIAIDLDAAQAVTRLQASYFYKYEMLWLMLELITFILFTFSTTDIVLFIRNNSNTAFIGNTFWISRYPRNGINKKQWLKIENNKCVISILIFKNS